MYAALDELLADLLEAGEGDEAVGGEGGEDGERGDGEEAQAHLVLGGVPVKAPQRTEERGGSGGGVPRRARAYAELRERCRRARGRQRRSGCRAGGPWSTCRMIADREASVVSARFQKVWVEPGYVGERKGGGGARREVDMWGTDFKRNKAGGKNGGGSGVGAAKEAEKRRADMWAKGWQRRSRARDG